MITVKLKNVTKTFGDVTAVDNLSLSVPQGSIYGFIGPNGSGKTTTLRMIMNIFYPDDGTIELFGNVMKGSFSDRIGYLPEERGLYRKMKVREILQFYGELKSRRNVDREIDNWLERLDLTDYAGKKVETLSKGMSQKVQFIATVVTQPDLVILDEPFSGLDPVNMDTLKEAVLEIQSQGTTVIFSTHDMNVAEKMCDYIFMIYRGKKVLDDTLSSIQDKFVSNTVKVKTSDGVSALNGLDGVESINDYGQVQELRITPDCNTQKLLSAIMERTTVNSFDVAKPSLHDIFLRIAGKEAVEVSNV